MATPYLQIRRDTVASTQDDARDLFAGTPVCVIAASQSGGRGRSGAEWLTAPRALACSVALPLSGDDVRPISLIAGVAIANVIEGSSLKWPNDVLAGSDKVGGILVERSGEVTVIGLGLNLWWPDAPEGMGSVCADDPGDGLHVEIGAVFAADLLRLLEAERWPIDRYRELCSTIGRRVTWQPAGEGLVTAVSDDGGLVVETESGTETIYSGAVSEVRG